MRKSDYELLAEAYQNVLLCESSDEQVADIVKRWNNHEEVSIEDLDRFMSWAVSSKIGHDEREIAATWNLCNRDVSDEEIDKVMQVAASVLANSSNEPENVICVMKGHDKILFTGKTHDECTQYMRTHRGWTDLRYAKRYPDGRIELGRMSSWVL